MFYGPSLEGTGHTRVALSETDDRDSLKVAEGRVALDIVLLLEAIKLCWVHIHPCQHLEQWEM